MDAPETYYSYRSPLGPITICATAERITRIALGQPEFPGIIARPSILTNDASTQLLEYLAGKRRRFSLPLMLPSQPFDRAVVSALLNVPYGEPITCTQLAAAAGHPGAVSATGRVVSANPLLFAVPDHRVRSAAGQAYGQGDAAKRREAVFAFEQTHASAH